MRTGTRVLVPGTRSLKDVPVPVLTDCSVCCTRYCDLRREHKTLSCGPYYCYRKRLTRECAVDWRRTKSYLRVGPTVHYSYRTVR
jgi:hypothetical protein